MHVVTASDFAGAPDLATSVVTKGQMDDAVSNQFKQVTNVMITPTFS